MIEVNEIPESGQFVLLWDFDGLPWSMVCKWDGDILREYDSLNDRFVVKENNNLAFYDKDLNPMQPRIFVVN